MSLVFLSTLGTNAYHTVTYLPLAGETSTAPTPYVQEARVAALLAGGSKPDRVVICVTEGPTGSLETNWTRRAMGRGLSPGTDGLQRRLLRLDPGLNLTPLTIPPGASETELWEILGLLGTVIQDKDELVVDITHGFRSQAIVLMTALDYLQRARRVTVSQVTYGAYEAQPRESREPRPTFDLTPFFVLRDWTAAIALLNAGDLRALGLALKAPRQALGRMLKKETPNDLARLPGALESLGDDLWCCRLRKLPAHVEAVMKRLAGIRKELGGLKHRATTDQDLAPIVASLQPLLTILSLLEDEVEKLQPKSDDPLEVYGLLAADFALRHGLMVQGFTLLRESLLDSVVRKLGAAVTGWSRRDQDTLLGSLTHEPDPENANDAPDPSKAASLLKDHSEQLKEPNGLDWLRKISRQTTDYRNKLDHCGTGDAIPSTRVLQAKGQLFVADALAFARAG